MPYLKTIDSHTSEFRVGAVRVHDSFTAFYLLAGVCHTIRVILYRLTDRGVGFAQVLTTSAAAEQIP